MNLTLRTAEIGLDFRVGTFGTSVVRHLPRTHSRSCRHCAFSGDRHRMFVANVPCNGLEYILNPSLLYLRWPVSVMLGVDGGQGTHCTPVEQREYLVHREPQQDMDEGRSISARSVCIIFESEVYILACASSIIRILRTC